VTALLAPLCVDHERHTAVPTYVYVPAGTPESEGLPVSMQLVDAAASRALAELPHAGVTVEPATRWT
jgi:hypothetical protein